MIPRSITRYLQEAGAVYVERPHRTTYQAHELASELSVAPAQVAKCVAVEVDGDPWLAVVLADEQVDLDALARGLDAGSARLLDESELSETFPGCELGAAPPFGRLYDIPVAADRSLTDKSTIAFNGGTHREAIEMMADDLVALEGPTIASFAVSSTGG